MTTPVVAAATVPSSLTSTTALCSTADTRSLSSLMPDRSAPDSKICLMPRDCRGAFREYLVSSLNLGRSTVILRSLRSER
uniref:Putative secreted protein n=1 Tax=Ixodes ricinus TaxID=34613 RepID=A0A6B0TVR2_IXORI